MVEQKLPNLHEVAVFFPPYGRNALNHIGSRHESPIASVFEHVVCPCRCHRRVRNIERQCLDAGILVANNSFSLTVENTANGWRLQS